MTAPILVWFRRDLRLNDHPALHAACQAGGPVIPVFIRDTLVDGLGAAPKFRLGLGLGALQASLAGAGSRLILRGGDAGTVLRKLLEETGARGVYWTRLYDPKSTERDATLKAELRDAGLEAKSFGGHLLFEPWNVETKTGGPFRVYSPFWRAVHQRDVDAPLSAPSKLPAPDSWPASDNLDDWRMDAAMDRGAQIVAPHANVGEAAAQARLAEFIETKTDAYKNARNFPGQDTTSNLSENLSLGEISPHQCWHAGQRAHAEGAKGAEHYLKEVVWREFAYHLMHHTPEILDRNWRADWDRFPWRTDADAPDVLAWKQGRTGIAFVDAAMREMYVTGRMHNRGRMIAASYLTKHMMCHWKIGMQWFEDCLIDWDPASNAMGWQWTAGSGPDAAPYFRIFNPVTQLDKFDEDRTYAGRWIAEGAREPHKDALSYFDAIPRSWGLSPSDAYPDPIVPVDEGRKRALGAYEERDF